jgi:hypothetical protein
VRKICLTQGMEIFCFPTSQRLAVSECSAVSVFSME